MRQVVCLSARPWSPFPTRTQQLMSRMKDAEVLFFEPAFPDTPASEARTGRKLRPNLIAYTLPALSDLPPSSLPARFSRRRVARFLQSTLERHHFREPVLWCDCPAALEYLDDIAYRGLVYDCYQDWSELPESWESDLVAEADVVFAASPDLAGHLFPGNPNVTLLPHGCNYPMFARDDLPRPALLPAGGGPIFGFVGTLWPDLDLTPLMQLADARRDSTIVLVGPDAGCRMLPALLREPNVLYVGAVEPVDLPEYLGAFDVCLHLLRQGELYYDIIPSRLFEYLSSGKPIVAMLHPDQVEYFPDVVYSAHSPAEFSLLASRALEETGTWARDRRREYGRAAAWSQRAQEVNLILENIALFE